MRSVPPSANSRKRIRDYPRNRIAVAADARRFGKARRGGKAGMWAYRVGDYRIAHRRRVYG